MVIVPERLAATCRETPERSNWLGRLPHAIRELAGKWSLSLGAPFDSGDVSCAWVAPVVRADGTHAVLKLGMPHFEGHMRFTHCASGTVVPRYACSKPTST